MTPPNEVKLLPMDIDVTVGDGKYRVLAESMMKNFRALRNGEEWRSLTGDNLIYFLAVELQELRASQPSSPTWVKDAAEEIGSCYGVNINNIEQILTRHAKGKV